MKMNYITVRRIRRKSLHEAKLVETEKNNENLSYHNDLRICYSYFCNIYTLISGNAKLCTTLIRKSGLVIIVVEA